MHLSTPLRPRDPNGPLKVIMLGRVSTVHQNVENIAASFRSVEEFLERSYPGPKEIRRLGEQASGMVLDRASILEAQALIESGRWDVVLAEDLSRIYRNPRFQWAFIHECVDNATRLICIADNLDTAEENWETMSHLAAIRHGFFVPDTRRRVRRTATHSFHNGGMTQSVRFGYAKVTREEADQGLHGPKGLRLRRLPECTPIIREMCFRVREGASCDAVADWLRLEGVTPGPKVRNGWTGRTVERLLRDPLLSGLRTFRKVVHQQVLSTGKYRRLPNPAPETHFHPELAHLSKEEHADLLAAMEARSNGRTIPRGSENSLWERPRSRTYWPGQHLLCGICGGRMYRYGKVLKCGNSVPKGPKTCWNHLQVDIAQVHTKVLTWILAILDRHPEARQVVAQAARAAFELQRSKSEGARSGLEKRIKELEKEGGNLARAIAKQEESEFLQKELARVQEALAQARREEREAKQGDQENAAFASCEDFSANLDRVMHLLAKNSFEFADLMRRLLPEFVVEPVQALDRPQIRPRARIRLTLASWCPEGKPPVEAAAILDLFDPPIHVRILGDCRTLKAGDPALTLKQIAAKLNVNHMAVKRALDYAKRMAREGTDDPYRPVRERPANASRWR